MDERGTEVVRKRKIARHAIASADIDRDIGLSEEFTILDTFMFFGRMYGIKDDDIRSKIKELAEVFDLPNQDSQIKSLSGGQKRRVSLAATLIHNARLLLLDEPTVGVDPIVSRNIWDFLERITKDGITVIITTHYVEEAKGAHRIGMMRDGELLAEDTPENVMSSQNAESLENAFLQLTLKHLSDAHGQKLKKRRGSKLQIASQKMVEMFDRADVFSKNRFWAQLNKNYLLIKRNPIGIILLMTLPIILSFLLCVAFGDIPLMKLAFVSDELGSRDFDELCASSEAVVISNDLNCTSIPFTCLYLDKLKKSTTPVIYRSEAEARAAVLKNEAWALLHVPFNFTATLTDLVIDGPGYYDQSYLDEILDKVPIAVHLDSSNFIMDQWLRKFLTERYQDFVNDLAVNCGLPEGHGKSPLRMMDPIYGEIEPKFSTTMLPGFLAAWCFYFTLLFTSGAVMAENMAGSLERNIVAGMTYLEMVAAHSVVQFVLIICQTSIMLVVCYGIYGHPLLGSPALAMAILFIIETIGMVYGFFITEVCSSDRIIVYVATVSLNCLFLVTGVVWPTEGAPAFLRWLFWAAPVTSAVDAYRSVAFRGHGITEIVVLKGLLWSFVWIVLFSFGAAFAYKCKRAKQLL